MPRRLPLLCALALALSPALAFAQTGKIAGTVTDAASGESLPGVNVVIDGTTQGATTDVDGYYVILNVTPGTYDVRASFVGYTAQVKEGVRVNIDLTSQIDFALQEQTVGLDEVVISANQEVVQRDLSASRVDVTAEQIENLPVADVASVVGLQAGVQGLSIRGSGADETSFRIDGFTSTSRRNNTPYTGISYAAVEEVQVQSGGFNAEYGDMRGGVVNLVTKEGPRDRYTADVILRYSTPSQKHFGLSPTDPNSYWLRSYMDPDVAFEGTTEGWDDYLQQQYPQFGGFDAISEQTLSDEDQTNDLTPQQAQDLFMYRHRRDLAIDRPDYTIDGGFGGPVPGVGRYLGDLRFFASYRQEEDQYIVPLTRDAYSENNARLKLTSDIASGMKLVVEGMFGTQKGTNQENRNSDATLIRQDGDREEIYGDNGLAGYSPSEDGMFGSGAYSLSDIDHNMVAAKLTHSLSERSFYEVSLQRMQSEYFSRPPRTRDTSCAFNVTDTYCVDEAPLGFSFESINSLEGMRMGAHWSEFRDSSQVTEWTGRFDLTSQVNKTNLVKVGVEWHQINQDINYGYLDFLINPNDTYSNWNESTLYGALYVQDKLEFNGMIANVGLRLDYLNPNTDWWVYENPYPEAFLGTNIQEMDTLLSRESAKQQLTLSPRVGVSFPITDVSKLYFNYGHFRQLPDPEELYQLERSYENDRVSRIANPNAPMPRTVAYELGYEQSLFGQYLIRIAGYYKDVSDQPRNVTFESLSGLINYSVNTPDNYEDIRGFEISLFRNAGKWFRGFINYTYQVESEGSFGFARFDENRVEQREYERNTRDHYQSKPLPQPYARVNLDFISPPDFGPEVAGLRPIGDWRLNFLGWWQSGEYATFTGRNNVPGIQDNLQWRAFRMVDMRLSKNFNARGIDTNFYIDVKNVFNLKNFNAGAFYGSNDFQLYMNSLRLPEEAVEGWESDYQPKDEDGNPLYGDDRPGDLDKDYIDPPNGSSFRYLFPRDVFFGLKFSF